MPKSKHLEMLDKLSMILKTLPTTRSTREISKVTNIPQTTVNKYLHNKKLISELLGIEEESKDYEEIFNLIDDWLDRAKKEGPSNGSNEIKKRYGNSYSGGVGKYQGTRKR